jgi:hypothetical protein
MLEPINQLKEGRGTLCTLSMKGMLVCGGTDHIGRKDKKSFKDF